MPLPALIPSPCDLQPACSHTALLCTATLASYSQNATASPTPPPTLLTQGKRKAIDEASPHSKKKKEEEEEAEAAEEHNVLFERLPDAGCDDDSGCQGVSPDQYDPKAHGNTGLGRRHISNRKERQYVRTRFKRARRYPRFKAVAADSVWDPLKMALYVKEAEDATWERMESLPTVQQWDAGGREDMYGPTFQAHGRIAIFDPSRVVPAGITIGDGGEVPSDLRIALLDDVVDKDEALEGGDGTHLLREVRFAPQKTPQFLFTSLAMRIHDGGEVDAWSCYDPRPEQGTRIPPARKAYVHLRHLVLHGPRPADGGTRRGNVYYSARLMAKLALEQHNKDRVLEPLPSFNARMVARGWTNGVL